MLMFWLLLLLLFMAGVLGSPCLLGDEVSDDVVAAGPTSEDGPLDKTASFMRGNGLMGRPPGGTVPVVGKP
jgi:hypothetical protein